MRMFGVVLDVTERKEAEEQLGERTANWKNAFESGRRSSAPPRQACGRFPGGCFRCKTTRGAESPANCTTAPGNF